MSTKTYQKVCKLEKFVYLCTCQTNKNFINTMGRMVIKEFAQFEFYSPLAQQANRLCSDYTVYVHKYKNGNICVKCYDGVSPKPYVNIRSVSENKLYTILEEKVPLYKSSGCKMVAYIDEDDGVITIFK